MKSQITKQALIDQFTLSEEALGVYYGNYDTGVATSSLSAIPEDWEESALLPSGLPMSRCTNSATYICEVLGGGDIYGFRIKDNPVESESVSCSQGHDFAVINGRFIVDPWISLYTGESKQGVFDIKDPKDRKAIVRIYGNCELWQLRKFTALSPPDDFPKNAACYFMPGDTDYPSGKVIKMPTRHSPELAEP